jgi:hypothetical protein
MTRDDILRLDLSSSPLPHDDAVDTLLGLVNGEICTDHGFQSVTDAVRRCAWHVSHVERVMLACDEVLGTYGVEAIVPDGDWRAAASYCNTGDTYAPTILYCHRDSEYMVTSWGDYVENMTTEDR